MIKKIYMSTAELSARDDMARQIRELRKEKGMTVKELAYKAEIGQVHLCEIFSEVAGNCPSFRSMIRIFDALGLKEVTIRWK